MVRTDSDPTLEVDARDLRLESELVVCDKCDIERSDASSKILATELAQTHAIIALPARADITSRAECECLVGMAKNTFLTNSKPFTIDIVINNAAIAFLGPMEEVKEDEFQRIYEVNVLGPILLPGACNL